MRIFTTSMVLLFSLVGSPTFDTESKRSLEGAWHVVEVQTINSDGYVSSMKPRESFVLFTQGRYSFCWTSHQSSVHSWQISDSEKVARYNQTLINMGTYNISDSTLTTHAQFALVPKFAGGTAAFRYSFLGDTLILTGVNVLSFDGELHPLYVKGSHIVNKLVRTQ